MGRLKLLCASFGASFLLTGQEDFNRLSAKQRELLEKAGGTAASYQARSLSERTTFEAVTNALERTTLTTEDGKRFGSVLDYVVKIEEIAGESKGLRGDEQFRVYAEVKPELRDVLDRTREFFRDKDNTVYHKGYPVNFRLTGRTPTIQISLARDKDHVDIDVDYRSSKLPKSMFNGHLSASNSDVRAGNNYTGHTRRWQGLFNWWKALFNPQAEQKELQDPAAAVADSVDAERGRKIEDVGEATEEFFVDWLVRRKIEDAARFLAPNAAACANEDDDEENEVLATGRTAALFFQILRSGAEFSGRRSNLEEAIRPVPAWHGELRATPHRHEGAFSLYEVDTKEVAQFTCRQKSSSRPASETPQYEGHYETIFRFADADRGATGMILLWTKVDGGWRILSFDQLER